MFGLSKKCGICNNFKRNDTLYFHLYQQFALDDPRRYKVFCTKEGLMRTLYDYCQESGLDYVETISSSKNQPIVHDDDKTEEVNHLPFPSSFVPLWDTRSQPGVDYLKNRGLENPKDTFYDTKLEGVAFCYYYESTFVGSQVRFLKSREKDGKEWKVTTLPGTKLGYLFWGWDQSPLQSWIKTLIVCEGAINAWSLQQFFNTKFKSMTSHGILCVATSGAGLSGHQMTMLKKILESGRKVVIASDHDDAGFDMAKKAVVNHACSHLCIPEDSRDWNDLLIEGKDLYNYLKTNLKKVSEQ